MPRSNLSDFSGESLTSDEEDEPLEESPRIEPMAPAAPASPLQQPAPLAPPATTAPTTAMGASSPERKLTVADTPKPSNGAPRSVQRPRGIARFRAAVRTVMRMRTLTSGAGAEPGVDVRKSSAAMLYGHLREKCEI